MENQFVLAMSMAKVKKVSYALKLINAVNKTDFLKKFDEFRDFEYRELMKDFAFPEIKKEIDKILDKLKLSVIDITVIPKIAILRDFAAEDIERISNYPKIKDERSNDD